MPHDAAHLPAVPRTIGLMAQHLTLRAVVDPLDREAFLTDIERICDLYGDQPHARARRDRELSRAVDIYVTCWRVEAVPARPFGRKPRSPST